MARSFGIVDYKVQEAEYFFNELRRVGDHGDYEAVQFCLSAFVSATRSITFAMQSSLKGNPEFDSWYEARQSELKNDTIARFFHSFRTVTQHIGANIIGGGSVRGGQFLYYFAPTQDIKQVPDMDVIAASELYFKKVLRLVFDCYTEFGTLVNGQQYFTQEHFDKLGKSIEDAEEEVGFPRGWTSINKPNLEPYRWELIRTQAGRCLIQQQFHKWLKLSVREPNKLPPYRPE